MCFLLASSTKETNKNKARIIAKTIQKFLREYINYPNWQYNEELQKHWVELVQILNSDPSEKQIEKALKKIGPECKLTVEEIKMLL